MEETRVQTHVDQKLLTRELARGSVSGGLGIVILLLAAIELPVQQLLIWGIPILIIGLGLIALGMIPYRNLAKRRDNPDNLTVTEENLLYHRGGKLTLTVPYEAIARVHYLNPSPAYGVLITLKDHPTARVKVHTHDYNALLVRHKTRRRYGADLFFPFFTHPDFEQLRAGLAEAGYSDDIPLA